MDEKQIPLLRVEQLRKEQGLSLMQLSQLAGVARNTARDYCRDVPLYLSRDVLLKFSEALQVPVRELFHESA